MRNRALAKVTIKQGGGRLTRAPQRTALAALGFLAASCASVAGELENEIPTWTKSGMLAGADSTEGNCVRDDRVWVRDGKRGFCIRFFKNDVALVGKVPVFFFTGDFVGSDWDSDGLPIRARYRFSYDGDRLFRSILAFSQSPIDSPFFFVSRPGSLGSSGDHKEKYKYRESRIVNAAIDQIKARYGIDEIALAGQSGGATLVANLLPKRSDVRCAVMASGAIALHRYAADSGFAQRIYVHWEDPVASAEKLKRTQTVFYILAGEGDKTRPPGYQKLYADTLLEKKLKVRYLVLRNPGNPHDLQDEALRVADGCARKRPREEIESGLNLAKGP